MNKFTASVDEQEFLSRQYPLVSMNGQEIKFNPYQHQLEKGEAAFYLDESGKVQKGIISKVAHSRPMNYPIYTINGRPHYFTKVWPNVDGQKVLDKAKQKFLELLSPSEKELLGI